MATIRWKSTGRRPTIDAEDTASAPAVVQVSRLELQHLRDVPGFIITAMRLRRDVLRADGALGVSLIAQPLRRTFWTLSAWTDSEAIEGFNRRQAASERAEERRPWAPLRAEPPTGHERTVSPIVVVVLRRVSPAVSEL
jgi:hypothetical protein